MKKITIVSSALALTILVGSTFMLENNQNVAAKQEKLKINDVRSTSQIREYKEELSRSINTLSKEVDDQENILVTVTFRKPLNYNQLTKIVEDYNINAIQIVGRAIQEEKTRSTFTARPIDGQLYDKKIIQEMLDQNDAKFKGFIEIVGEVKDGEMVNLISDNKVYSLDPSADKHYSLGDTDTKPVQGLYWRLENNNMTDE
ncbi:hypothetical protein VQL36_04930 [Chengkuizengella sp. SCS-71B]|uniref:hypothetical protein n=1 Tax=Chengkuizengella sp. SCS-71B TaxID=3115290 RepID=UPI0032C2257A